MSTLPLALLSAALSPAAPSSPRAASKPPDGNLVLLLTGVKGESSGLVLALSLFHAESINPSNG